jgi:hypothetical protein
MTVTGMANLAVKVRDVDVAAAWYVEHGFAVSGRMTWNGIERADVFVGPIQITLFDRALYETGTTSIGEEGFLHPALFCDDLDAQLTGHRIVYGPEVVSGPFGRRRIAFVEAPGGIRLEFMEQLDAEEPSAT